MDALKLIAQDSLKAEAPKLNVGDTVKVHVRIAEGDKFRIQIFEGTVIAKKHGGVSETFTVRRVAHAHQGRGYTALKQKRSAERQTGANEQHNL